MTPEPSSGSYRLEVAAVPSGGPQVVGAPPQSVGDVDGGRGQTAFVLGGGGSLGAAQVGMLRALLEVGVRPTSWWGPPSVRSTRPTWPDISTPTALSPWPSCGPLCAEPTCSP